MVYSLRMDKHDGGTELLEVGTQVSSHILAAIRKLKVEVGLVFKTSKPTHSDSFLPGRLCLQL